MPEVTVLMPVYNAGRFLRAAIESILNQTFDNYEFLIINDASTDMSRSVISSYKDERIRLVDNERNLGLAGTLNKGLRLASAEIIARHDADDIAHPRRLEEQLQFLRQRGDVVLVGSQSWVIDENGNYSRIVLGKPCEDRSIRWDLLFDNSFIHSTVMFRKDVIFNKLGGYDESFVFCQDYELWSRVASGYRLFNLPARLMLYRTHPDSMTERMREISALENHRIIQRSMNEFFCDDRVSNEEVDLIIRYRYGMECDRVSLRRLLKLMKRLREQYERRYPGVDSCRDYRKAIARQYAKLIYRVARAHPMLSLTILSRDVMRFPLISVSISWCAFLVFAVWKNAFRQFAKRPAKGWS